MTRKGQRRAKTINVPESWLRTLRERRAGDPLKGAGKVSYKDLGRGLASVLGLPEPIPISTVYDYMTGRVVTEDLTQAFAELWSLPLPPAIADVGSPKIREWAELGAELHNLHPERFERELAALRDLIAAMKRYSSR